MVMRAIGIVMVICGVLLSGLVVGAMFFAGWVVGTQDGARWVFDWIPRAGLAELRVENVEGRLLGPLSIEGLKLEVPGVQIELDHARLEWAPGALLRSQARISNLAAGTLVVRLREKDDEPQDDTPARVPQLPVSVIVDRASLDRLEVHLPPPDDANEPEAPPQVVTGARIDRFEWVDARFAVEHLEGHHDTVGGIAASAQATLAPASVRIEKLAVVTSGEKPARIDAQGLVRLDDRDSHLDLKWTDLRWPLLGEPTVTSRSGTLKLEGTAKDLRAQTELALGDTASIRGHGHYAAEQLEARLDWTNLTWPLSGAPRVASAKGGLDVTGTPQAYRYSLDADLAAEGQKGNARASGSGGLDHIVLDALRFAVAKAKIEGKARVEWSPALVADSDLRVQDLDPGLIAPAWPGRLNGTVKARTTMHGEEPEVQFTVALKDSRLRDYPLALDARGTAIGASVKLDAMQLVTGQTKLEAQGQVTPPFDLTARLDSPNLAALWPGLRGRAKLDASVRGSLEAPHVIAKGAVDGFEYDTLVIRRADLDADVDLAGAWKLDLAVLELSGPTTMARAQATLAGRASDHVLKLGIDSEPADIDLEFHGAFDVARQAWSGTVASGRAAPEGLTPWTLEEAAALRIDAASVRLEPACWSAADSRACAQVTRQAGLLRAAFRLEQLDFAYFKSFLPAGWELTGGVDGTGLFELRDGVLSEARADLATDPTEVRRDGQLLLQAERGSLLLEEVGGRVVARVKLPLQNGLVKFDGELAAGGDDYATRPLSGQLDVKLEDLGFLRIATEEITKVSGRIEGRMNWTGTLARPRPEGQIELLDATLDLATPGIELTELRARVGTQADDGVLKISASAKSGGGTLTVDGSANLASEPRKIEIAIRGDQFQAADMAEARAWVSPKLDLNLVGNRLELRGDIEVPRADITPPSFDTGIGVSSDQVIITGEQKSVDDAKLELHADVRLVLGSKVRFEGFGLKTRLEGSVRAIEMPGRSSSGRGEVRLVEGRYKAYGQDLEIETGRLLFNGGPLTEPAIEIRALRKPREDIEVGVMVRGTLDKPEFQLFSTPAMPRERQLSWLVLGRSIEEGNGADERAMLANAALSLGLTGTDFLAQNVRGGLGIDDISIGAEAGEQADQARFTVGKYLSPKLYVSYGVGIFQPGQVFKLLYDLGHGFKFSTESGVHTGGDLLYTLER
ncbi:autotransporter secretion inner membrane protein TamB [Panacagrimonas perspica]|uniref:Autotransporter secretion inner membrane protein TamB n=1 Tax=Panacagrimonas perspica TaxID=381431 RepID=A0A4S3K9I7_9GAMM|nr:translocation/assembly module TamB domain-containing protein [Panacagrimonas perspica]TDU28636.1 autotransporter secretion inner membrane protein TamB [Panacagrimonas perspica]THD04965.1 hypothetical protein B1810_03195 [Panacagrimonas perspica]